jgi:hypothetical protein
LPICQGLHHPRKSNELLDYERTLHKDLKIEKWKELCFYHKRDFETMFTESQSTKLLDTTRTELSLSTNTPSRVVNPILINRKPGLICENRSGFVFLD